ncbi:MAG TPA: hypothetical protein PKY59_22300 [Pyrinomonadaceae bacterium]|nr:hypothetical protein [Pyrinomonadaceae bacterium]
MRLEKIVLCAAALLTAFGASIGIVAVVQKTASFFAPFEPEISSIGRVNVENFQSLATESKTPEKAEEIYVKREFDKTGEDGYYYIIGTSDIDDQPKGFKDFDFFELNKTGYDKKTDKFFPIKPNGSIYTANDSFNLPRLKISGEKISFTSIKRRGISYQFEGNFTDETIPAKNSIGKEYLETIALKGKLTKYKNGVKIAEAYVNFGYTVGC